MPLSLQRRRQLRKISVFVLGLGFVGIGLLHFIRPEPFEAIVPPFLPWARAIVYLSGVAEIALGVGVLVPRTRRLAAWGLIALLVAVFPANLYHAFGDVQLASMQAPLVYHVIRLPMQLVLIAWAWWHTRPELPAAPLDLSASARGAT